MHALNATSHHRSHARPVYFKAARSRRRDQCPQCDSLVPGPVASTRQPGGVVEHLWTCESCDCDWRTCFHSLLV
jgi:RNase P subunit RPR2